MSGMAEALSRQIMLATKELNDLLRQAHILQGVEIFIDIHQHFSEPIERPCPEVMVRLLKEI